MAEARHMAGEAALTAGDRGAEGEAEVVPEEGDKGRRSEGPGWKLQNLRDFTVNTIFPTDPKLQ
jgi:hypothetical protein